MDSNDALVVFKGAKIRRIWQDEQWYFSVVEVIQAITDSVRQRKYWSDLSEKIGHLKIEVYEKIVRLIMTPADGMQGFANSAKVKRRYQA